LVETNDGTILTINKVKVVSKLATVYNFKVKEYHSYYVSNLGVWTHNSCKLSSKAKESGEAYNRKKHYGSTPSTKARKSTLKRDNFTCQYCGSKDRPEADHNPSLKSHWYKEGYKMTLKSRKAWANSLDNLTTACRSCNRSKGTKTFPEEWTVTDKYKTRKSRWK
jgi:5-methylcytosine-specific restriction endonuclease McrA